MRCGVKSRYFFVFIDDLGTDIQQGPQKNSYDLYRSQEEDSDRQNHILS